MMDVRKTQKQFVSEVAVANPNIQVIGQYQTAHTKIRNLAKASFGINFKEKSFAADIIKPLEEKRIIEKKPTEGTHGGNAAEIKLNPSIKVKIFKPIVQQIEIIAGNEVAKYIQRPLSYDFYLPTFNILIECQGQQHFEPIDYFGGDKSFKRQKQHDRRKREYAKKNNFIQIEIPYWDYDRIPQILDAKLKTIKPIEN